MKKTLPVANGLALVITIVINYLSNTGVFQGNTMATISASYPTLFTPAGYTFTIWIAIYLGLLGFIAYQGRSLFGNTEAAVTVQQVGWWFVLSCLANCAWVLAWLYESTGLSLLIMLLLFFCLLKIILRTDMELTDPPLRTIAAVWWPFCLYFGWITAALMANLSVWLLKMEWSPYVQHPEAWTLTMIAAAAAVYLYMTWRRNMREYAFAGVWALIGIAMADHPRPAALYPSPDSHNHPQSAIVTIVAYSIAALLTVSSSIHGYRNRKFSPIYHPFQTAYRSALSFLSIRRRRFQYARYKGTGFNCNFCGATYEKFAPEYPAPDIASAINGHHVIAGYGENVFCPHCGSKNRERLIKAVLETHINLQGKKILHFSPEKNLYRYIAGIADVTTVDITPGFYRNIDPHITYADATRLSFANKSFDIVIANHILEHIPEDTKAIKEIFRVLKTGGAAILQVPYSASIPKTLEDPSIDDPQQQARLYGQKDHVRIYALNDYLRRLENAGFQLHLLHPVQLTSFRIYAIQPEEIVFLVYKNPIYQQEPSSI